MVPNRTTTCKNITTKTYTLAYAKICLEQKFMEFCSVEFNKLCPFRLNYLTFDIPTSQTVFQNLIFDRKQVENLLSILTASTHYL